MIERGYSPEYLFQMDYISFKLLVDASDRVNSIERVEDFWLSAAAAQGDSKGMKEATAPYLERAGLKPVSSPKNGPAAFKRKFGRGI